MTTLLWVLLSLFILALVGLSYRIADRLLYARRQPLTRLPAGYGLPCEDVSFPSRYGLRLQGWWIPATPADGKAVILLHPFGGNRQGLDACQQGRFDPWQPGVDLLQLAQAFHTAGYAVLLFDFRSHGQSERGLCAGGLTEDQDVVGAVDYTFQRLEADAVGITPVAGVVGFGSGAAALLTAVGREKGSAEIVRFFSGDSEGGSGFVEYQPAKVKRLCFLVAVEPASLGLSLRRTLRRSLPPLDLLLMPLVNWWCWQRGGYPLRSTYLPGFVQEIHLPLLYIGARPGKEGTCSEVQRLYEATPPPKEICWLDGSDAEAAVYADLVTHPQAILSFAMRYTKIPAETRAVEAA